MSNRKGATLRALAERFVDGELSDESLARMSDEEVEAALTDVPGVGPWTAHGFLIVALDRPDVLLTGDLALRRAVQRAYGFDHAPTQDEMVQVGRAMAPLPEPGGQLSVRIRVRARAHRRSVSSSQCRWAPLGLDAQDPSSPTYVKRAPAPCWRCSPWRRR